MSANFSSDSPKTKVDSSECVKYVSRYALYLFNNNKHLSISGNESYSNEKRSSTSSNAELEEPSVCLSLLEGNIDAKQETVVRCYLLNTLSLREDLSFENEGKYTFLQFSEEAGDSFGCYYHRLSKVSNLTSEDQYNEKLSKLHTFFICLIDPENGIIESFCPELCAFCHSLRYLLDHEGMKNRESMQLRLKSWFVTCIEYVARCIKDFQDDIPLILLCSLWGNFEVKAMNPETKWDIERFIETCSLMAPNTKTPRESSCSSEEMPFILSIKENGKIEIEGKDLVISPYCLKWYEKLKNCSSSDHKGLRSILEGFKLKAIQDLNTLKRLLQKAVNDHYSLYKAYLFLEASGFEDILLYHVKKEAHVTNETEILDVIKCLQEFIREQNS